jgi:hypothetical protein
MGAGSAFAVPAPKIGIASTATQKIAINILFLSKEIASLSLGG